MMRLVVAVDWSEQAFTAVKAVTQMFAPKELTLVHAIDLRSFESPTFAPAIAKQAYEAFRGQVVEGGQRLLTQTAELVPADVSSVQRLCEIGSPSGVILDTVRSARADLVVVGSRGRNRLGELVLGSVSHRVLMHASCSALIVKRPLAALRRVLLAIEGADDVTWLRLWLQTHPFRAPVDLSIISVVPTTQYTDPAFIPVFPSWEEQASRSADQIVRTLTADLNGSHYTATGRVLKGDPAAVIAGEADGYDLVVAGSHARKGIERFLLGSVSHVITHVVPCPVLVVRKSGLDKQ